MLPSQFLLEVLVGSALLSLAAGRSYLSPDVGSVQLVWEETCCDVPSSWVTPELAISWIHRAAMILAIPKLFEPWREKLFKWSRTSPDTESNMFTCDAANRKVMSWICDVMSP
jgi:hypothetical protein